MWIYLKWLTCLCCFPLSKLSPSRCLVIAFIYGFAAASMAFINKAVLNTFQYDYPLFIVTVQMLFTVLVLELLRMWQFIKLEPFTIARGKSFFIPSVLYALNCVIGLSALSDMNIPMFGMMKRCAPIVVLVLGVVVLRNGFPNLLVSVSVCIITLGCIIAGKSVHKNCRFFF